MRKVVVVSLAVAGGLCLVLCSACSSSNSDASSAGDGGAEGGIIRHPDGGTSQDGGTGGTGGVVTPTGSQILSWPTAYLEGVTDDGYAIYQDTTTSALYAVSVSTPNAQPTTITMQSSDYMGGGGAPIVVGKSVLMLSGLLPTSQVGKLTAWTAAGGMKQLSTASAGTTFAADVTSDGSKIAFYDNATESHGALGTGDLVVSNIDGTNRMVLATKVTLEGGPCQMPSAQLLFVGADLVALSCPPASGGMPEAGTAEDAGADGGGEAGAPAGPPETLTLYAGTSWTPTPIASDLAFGGSFGSDRALGKPGTRILFQSSAGLVDYVVASGTSTVVTDVPLWTAAYTPDSSQILFVSQAGNVGMVPVTGGSSTTLASGAFNYIVGMSPDSKSKYALVATSEARDPTSSFVTSSDLYLMSTTSPNAPSALVSGATAQPYGQAFTADSNFAVYDDNVLGGVGDFYVQATSGAGSPIQLGSQSWIDDEPTGSLVIFNVNCANCMTMYVPGQADIQYVDLSKGMTPTTVVTQADYNFYLTKDKSKLVYSWHPTANSGGDAGALAGIWVWPLP
jgi:hypothetical protein